MYQLKNTSLCATISPHGAELISLKDHVDCEYIWQADPAWWPQHAPILFPIVGTLRDNQYTWKGQRYELPIHGFASTLLFRCVDHSSERLVMEATANPDTQKAYPFNWSLTVHYLLQGNTLTTCFNVYNTGPNLMPFAIGGHPGFSLSWSAGDQKTDFSLSFANRNQIESGLLDRNRLLTKGTQLINCQKGHLPYSDDLISDHALILKNLKSKTVTLSSSRHPQKVSLHFEDFPNLGIWSIPDAPFICLEPWFSHVDTADHDGNLKTKEGMIQLASGGHHKSSFCITVEHPGG